MKKLFLLIAVIACFVATANAQDRTISTPTQFSFYGTTADTLDNSETKTYMIAVQPFCTAARMYAKVTNVSGTSNIKAVLQISYDNVYYKGVDSVTVTTAIPTVLGLTVVPNAPYVRVRLVGTGTQKSIPRIFVALDNR